MAKFRRRRTFRTRRSSGRQWRAGRWTGDQFGFPCQIAAECPTLLGGSPFCIPPGGGDICASVVYFPLLNAQDFGGSTDPVVLGQPDTQVRVTALYHELDFTMSYNPAWILDAQRAGLGVGLSYASWRMGIWVLDDDEPPSGLYSMFNELWLTRERILYYTGGRFGFFGGSTVDHTVSRRVRLRKATRLQGGQGIYGVWEVGCMEHEGGSFFNAEEMFNAAGGPVCLQGFHRCYYLNS